VQINCRQDTRARIFASDLIDFSIYIDARTHTELVSERFMLLKSTRSAIRVVFHRFSELGQEASGLPAMCGSVSIW